jgi:beta-glucosidase
MRQVVMRGWLPMAAALLAMPGVFSPVVAVAAEPAYLDAKRDVPARVADLLGRMTLDEKLEQLHQDRGEPAKKGATDPPNAAEIRAGLGSVIWSNEDPAWRNRLQRIAVEQSRLHIPMAFALDVIHGYRTVFPISAGLSCAWDPSLFDRLQAVAGREARASGIDWAFAPMCDVARDPRWGRVAETCGEDPYLGSLCVAAEVRGFQGGTLAGDAPVPSDRVAACLKHFVGYSADVGGRDYNTTPVTEFELRNVHLPPFLAGVNAGALTIMSSFNAIDGIPMSANPHTLNEILRDQWHFSGVVVSDWAAVGQEIAWGYARDDADAAALALAAGNDIEMCSRTDFALPAEVRAGRMPIATIDRAVARMLTVKFRLGLFEHPYVDADAYPAAVLHPGDLALAREAVTRSAVLLKNDGALPISKGVTRLALIGPMADDASQMIGCWRGMGHRQDVVTLAAGIRAKLGGHAQLDVQRGCDLIAGGTETQTLTDGRIVAVSPTTRATDSGIADAVKAAGQADAVVMALGEPSGWTGENTSRATLGFTGQQEELFEAVAATGKPVVVVVFSGRPLALPTVLAKAKTVIFAWQPGVQAGNGLADLLFGDAAFSGRLTQSVPAEVGQVPVYYNHDTTGRPGGHLGDYRDAPTRPRFSFGFGLTGSTVRYGPATVRPATAGQPATAVATITNTGPRPADEVVQLYVRQLACAQGARPAQELRGFQHVTLAPGEARQVNFALTDAVLGYFQRDGRFVTDNGDYRIWIAPQASNGESVSYRRG